MMDELRSRLKVGPASKPSIEKSCPSLQPLGALVCCVAVFWNVTTRRFAILRDIDLMIRFHSLRVVRAPPPLWCDSCTEVGVLSCLFATELVDCQLSHQSDSALFAYSGILEFPSKGTTSSTTRLQR